jgi:hypothetical protein
VPVEAASGRGHGKTRGGAVLSKKLFSESGDTLLEQPDWGLFGKFQNVALDIVAKKRILHVFANGYAF